MNEEHELTNEQEHRQMSDLGRRGFMKGIGITAGAATVGTASMSSTASAIDAPSGSDLDGLAGKSLGYLYERGVDLLTGSDYDEDAYEDAQESETYAGLEETVLDMVAADDQVFTQATNLMGRAKQLAFSDARYKAIEAMNLDLDEDEVRDRAEEEVDEFFAAQEENIIAHFSLQNGKAHRMFSRQYATFEEDKYLQIRYDEGSGGDWDPDQDLLTASYTLLDGTNFTYNHIPHTSAKDFDLEGDNYHLRLLPEDTGEELGFHYLWDYEDFLSDVSSNHSEVIDEINDFIDGVYGEYESGDIDLSDVVSGSELARMASDDEETPIAGAELAAMGLNANTDSQMTVDYEGETFNGSIYMMNSPEDGIQIGETYSPSDYDGPVYLSYVDGEGGSETIELQDSFTIVEATDRDGEELESVEYSDRAEQSTVTTDTEELNEELQQLNDLQIELQEQQAEIAAQQGGGGIGFGGGDSGTLAAAAAVGAAIIFLFGGN